MRKRFISSLLVLCMTLTLLPIKALAVESRTALKDPEVTELTVTYDDGGTDKTISLLPAESNQTQIPLPADGQLTFQIRFDNWEQLDKVYVTSTRGSSTKYLEATADGTTGCYIASGCFDPDDTSYVPGKISVEYTKKTDNIKIGDNVDWNTLQAAMKNYCTTTVSSYSGETAQAAVDISKLLDAEEDVVINFVIDMFDETTGSDLNSWLGAYEDFENAKRYALDGGNYFLYMDYTDPASYAMIVRDLSGNKYIKLIVEDVGQTFSSMSKVAEKVSQINRVSSLVYDYLDIKNSADDLRAEIAESSSLSVSQKLQLNAAVDDYETDRRVFALLTTILPPVVAAIGGTMAGPAIVFTALLGAINATADTFWDYRIGMIQGCEQIEANFTDNGCGVPLTWDIVSNDGYTITKSGHYYFVENGPASVKIGDGTAPVNVTLCIHGKEKVGIRISSGSVLNLCDCKYVESEENSSTKAVGVGMDSGCELILNSGMIGDYGSGAYGSGSNLVVSSNSKLIVKNGTITYGIHAEENSEIIINGGIINTPKLAGHYEHSIWSYTWVNSNIEIHGGQLTGAIKVYDSTENESNKSVLRIDDGLVGGISVDDATLTIKGGTVQGLQIGENCTATITEGTIVNAKENGFTSFTGAISNDGNLSIYNSTVTGRIANNKNGTINIDGGTFENEGGVCIENSGVININNGFFQRTEGDCIQNNDGSMVINNGTFRGGRYAAFNTGTGRRGTLTINGGEFYGAESAVANRIGDIIISSGYFHGPIGINTYPWDCKTSLLINGNSIIEIDTTESASSKGHLSPQLPIDAVAGYNSGLTYYNSANAVGIPMTIEEAAEINFSAQYIRLVADNAPNDPPTGGNSSSNDDSSGDDSSSSGGSSSSGSSSDGSSSTGSSSASGGRPSSSGSSASVSSVNTSTVSGETVTTAVPVASTQSGRATVSVSTTMGNEAVKQAVANSSESVVIAPSVTGSVTKAVVSIPAATVGQIGSQTNANLTISTPVANVAIPNGGLDSLSSVSGTVTVAAEKTGNTVELTVTAGGSTMTSISGGLTLTIPVSNATPGTVAVIVNADSTREVVRKSVVDNGAITIPLDGSAKIEIVDNSKYFADVPATNWAADAIAFASAHELFNGTGANQFSPNLPMSRGMLAVVLHNLENNPYRPFSAAFSDVGSNAWYAEGVTWAAANGIVDGYGNGQFGPSDNITREQLAVMLWRYAGKPIAANRMLNFADAGKASSWAMDALFWATEIGVINGKGNGILDPTGFATRAETAQMLKNYLEK